MTATAPHTQPAPDHNSARTLDALKASHTPRAIAARLNSGPDHSYLRDFVYGAIDGTVTTFAVVAGVAGAQLPAGIVVVLGVANLVGDGFSMAASNYLGTRTEVALRERYRQMEIEHIKRVPDGEREEVRQIFAAKGFSGEDLERAVDTITSDQERWVNVMLTDELGVALESPSALRAAWTTFAAFVLCGLVPLVVYLWQLAAPASMRIGEPFVASAVLTGATFFGVGAMRSRFIDRPVWRSGLETLLIGSAAAAMAFVIGALLSGVATMH
ncbi:MAG: VIT1/CCC1 transporter family protein [Planctomycetota bacterium]